MQLASSWRTYGERQCLAQKSSIVSTKLARYRRAWRHGFKPMRRHRHTHQLARHPRLLQTRRILAVFLDKINRSRPHRSRQSVSLLNQSVVLLRNKREDEPHRASGQDTDDQPARLQRLFHIGCFTASNSLRAAVRIIEHGIHQGLCCRLYTALSWIVVAQG